MDDNMRIEISQLRRDILGLRSEVSGIKNDITSLKGYVLRLDSKIDKDLKKICIGDRDGIESIERLTKEVKELNRKMEREINKLERFGGIK
ncbi:hypothetical protein L0P54_07350 [Anaerosalibacter bizertensis]|uniref:Uncharacterized protein n=1 Tax=Anaerosalibacter bizertensis TaxID=932217 RepID=A0A9Q4AE38_9FIRM|nr:hypothetical protein [Anaerosalibacter bizertensis]MBV1818896.1 hypothetical protein [Bacteroidales bacterium MSK.15.36]MCB5559856.1 hypothetical protein [Anaerosalibacter bizertensis]MCG4565697.1 hypothetical protein [Anaerosalibacter bizertensis]MCG4582800.1 hypothetical protein [Anaerosalibacter bizertensis]